MDIWIVAAAAGAGYVAQHLKNFVKGKQSLSDSSWGSPTFAIKQQIQDQNFHGDAIHREKLCQEISVTGMVSSGRLFDNSANANMIPNLTNGDSQRDNNESRVHEQEMGVSYHFAKKKSSVGCRKSSGRVVKPLSSLESCLMAQLCKEHGEMEEYTFSSICPPCTPTVRPFLVTDGTRIISRASKPYTDNCFLLEKATTNGAPPLPRVGSMELHRKIRTKTRMEQNGKKATSHSSSSPMVKHQTLQESSQRARLFGIGVSIGILSSFLANKHRVDKLNELLKQSENLVQDLQEELEMKDSLTVKELAVEDYESQDTQNDTFNTGSLRTFSSEEKHNHCPKEYYDQKKTDAESFSKIEAELAAELEMLELNMSSRKLSNTVELDTNEVPDMVKGELKGDDLFGGQDGDQPYADRDGSGSSTPRSANYAVSPMELSLRLHEVIRSRLEGRVEELERALQNSEKKVRLMESERISHWREFSNSESGTSSMQGSPVIMNQQQQQHSHVDQPVVINLSGDALDAYNEAYDEFAKMKEEEEDAESPSGVNQEEEPWLRNGLLQNSFTERRKTMAFSPPQSRKDNGILLPNDCISSGDQSDGGDEMEELLIRHIVEKAKKGSPAVLNAQKILFSLHENEH